MVLHPYIGSLDIQYFWDGGVHCLTADVRRKGKQEKLFLMVR